MELCVYSGAGGVLVFVPEPCRPPLEAEQSFGPLHEQGRMRAETTSAWAGILEQIDRHLFAVVSPDAVEGLLHGSRDPAT
ncbi:hypothetical protein [Lysobacter humi (ex Lee et al. 2017)]